MSDSSHETSETTEGAETTNEHMSDDLPGAPGGIVDPGSFDARTSAERAVAGLLFYKELDCLIELAHCVSVDFFDRPQLYRDVGPDVVRDLTALRTRYGSEEDFLSREQRHQIFVGVFGQDEAARGALASVAISATNTFAALRDQLLAAVAAYVERVFNTSEEMLRAAVRVMHVYLKDYLEDVTGASVEWSRTVGLPAITDRCYRILRDHQIAGRFGVNREPGPGWPVAVDANGSKLVEQISGTPMRVQSEEVSRGAFNDKQQLALQGAEALATIIDYDGGINTDAIDLLITKCYTWYAARGRVLQLPITVPLAANAALDVAKPMSRATLGGIDGDMPSAAPPALTPALEVPPTNGYGNRSLFSTTVSELRR